VVEANSSARAWTLRPGDKIKRTDLHARFGGSGQGGITPSSKSPNVFFFTDPATGEQHGYIDSWKDDGCFHYTGEGQRGDQQMLRGNRSLLRAREEGRSIRAFLGSGGLIEYMGEFATDEARPYYMTDAPETGGGPVRSVIVFRLRPVEGAPQPPSGVPSPPPATSVSNVPVEEHNTEKAFVEPSREPYEAERRESQLVQQFKAYLEAQGHNVSRLKIQPAGEAKPMFSDLWVEDLNLLVEAKGSTDRQSIRMAIGQLIDYRRFVTHGARCAVLLPAAPREDLAILIAAAGMEAFWASDGNFDATWP
jgi:hypothetical protein